MARKLFGTDGVRGVAGEFLTAELALALGACRDPPDAAERPQVLIVRDTRESGEMLEAAVAAGVSAAGGDALLGGRAADARRAAVDRPLRPRPRGRDLGLAQPLPRQRHQVLRRRRLQALRREPSWRSSAALERSATRPRASRRIDRPRSASCSGAAEDYLRELHARFAGLDLAGLRRPAGLRQRRDLPGRAGDLPATRRARDGARRRSPTGATSTPAAARPTSRRSPSGARRAATRSASPSTATATACWRSTRAARSSTATS